MHLRVQTCSGVTESPSECKESLLVRDKCSLSAWLLPSPDELWCCCGLCSSTWLLQESSGDVSHCSGSRDGLSFTWLCFSNSLSHNTSLCRFFQCHASQQRFLSPISPHSMCYCSSLFPIFSLLSSTDRQTPCWLHQLFEVSSWCRFGGGYCVLHSWTFARRHAHDAWWVAGAFQRQK